MVTVAGEACVLIWISLATRTIRESSSEIHGSKIHVSILQTGSYTLTCRAILNVMLLEIGFEILAPVKLQK